MTDLQPLRDLRFQERLLNHMLLRQDQEAKLLLTQELANTNCNWKALLRQAALYGNAATARYLIQLGTEVDCSTLNGNTPLMLAVQGRHAATVKVLLEAGARIDIGSLNDESVLREILRLIDEEPFLLGLTKQFEILEVLFRRLKNQMSSVENLVQTLLNVGCSLFHVAFSNDVEALEYMLKLGVAINSKGCHDMTALFGAVALGNIQLAKWLIQRGSDVNLMDRFSRPALFFAASFCDKKMMKLLLKRGADPNARAPKTGYTPLFVLFASSKPQAEEAFDDCVELLLQYGAIPQNPERATIFDHALAKHRSSNGTKHLIAWLAMLGSSIAKNVMLYNERWDREILTDVDEYYEAFRNMLGVVVFENFSLLDLLLLSERKMKLLVRNEKFVSEVMKVCCDRELGCLYYFKTLGKRVTRLTRANSMANLENKASNL